MRGPGSGRYCALTPRARRKPAIGECRRRVFSAFPTAVPPPPEIAGFFPEPPGKRDRLTRCRAASRNIRRIGGSDKFAPEPLKHPSSPDQPPRELRALFEPGSLPGRPEGPHGPEEIDRSPGYLRLGACPRWPKPLFRDGANPADTRNPADNSPSLPAPYRSIWSRSRRLPPDNSASDAARRRWHKPLINYVTLLARRTLEQGDS